MKRRILMIVGATALMAVPALAQTPAPKPPATNQPAATASTQAAKTKIAILSFAALRELIGELKVKYEKLQAEFNPRAIELDALQNTISSK